MIAFNKPCNTNNEEKYVIKALKSDKISGDGYYSKKCEAWFENRLKAKKVLLTPSCTAALEMSAMLINIKQGDEVIMPSYTFVSTANAFVLRGAKIIFVDINPKTMNIDENLIEDAITDKTKAIILVHYAGISCDIDKVVEISKRRKLYLIEDAAQAMEGAYKGKALGTFGDIGTFSFHETKNYTSGGEGGLLILNNDDLIKKSEIIREKGTNRNQFFRGEVDKYSWVDLGSSYLPSELQSAYLWGQLENVELIKNNRLSSWSLYYELLKPLAEKNLFELPFIPEYSSNNAHIFYLKLKNIKQRTKFINYLKENGVYAVFHYIPLHSSIAGLKFGEFIGKDQFTTTESERLVRLPMFYGLKKDEIEYISDIIKKFFN
jgi:dTDP-4-amino-4,6-dideoxygalactose transaminase